MEKQKRGHHRLVLVSLPFQGHKNPMLQLGSVLHFKGFSITALHTAFNSPNPSNHPEFRFVSIPDNLSDEIISSGNLVVLISVLNVNCQVPFQECLVKMVEQQEEKDEIARIIYDECMYFSEAAAKHVQLPSIILRTTCASTTIPRNSILQREAEVTLTLQGTSSAVNLNTVDVLERSSLQKIQEQCQVPVFPIDPSHKFAPASSSSLVKDDTSCITWLDKQIQKSVLYVSLGSVAFIDKNEVVEMAWGLANSKQPFLWVIRPGLVDDLEWNKLLPEGFIEAEGENGCIVKWAS